MKIRVLAIIFFAISYSVGFFMGKTYETTPEPVVNIPKKEDSFKSQEIGIVGPCKVYAIRTQPDYLNHMGFTVICPSEYSVAVIEYSTATALMN